MNNATHFFVQQKMQQCAGNARAAMARVRQAKTLREVRDWGCVRPDSIIASLDHLIPEMRQLERARADRAQQLVEAHLQELRTLLQEQGLDAFKKRVGQLHQNDWIFLRGEHAGLYRRLDRDLATIEHQWRQKQATGSPPPADPCT